MLIALAMVGALIVWPAVAQAKFITFGSRLSVKATRNTTRNLAYKGTNTPVPASPEAPKGLYHTFHFGTDTALWNTVVAHGRAAAPASGQIVSVKLEGCAVPAAGGPVPLTQIHSQDVSPVPGGGAHINYTAGPFEMPVCGSKGARGSIVNVLHPINLCAKKGDYIAFSDEGGYVEHFYQSGVPYEVIGRHGRASMDSYLGPGGSGPNTTILRTERSAMEGFAKNPHEELMLQARLGTGPNGTALCPGGTAS